MSNNNNLSVKTDMAEDEASSLATDSQSAMSPTAQNMATASTETVDNTESGQTPSGGGSPSRNSLAASRLLRNRRGDRGSSGTRGTASIQLIYNQNEADDLSSVGTSPSEATTSPRSDGAKSPFSSTLSASSSHMTPINHLSPRANAVYRNPGAAKLVGKAPKPASGPTKPVTAFDAELEQQQIIETVNASHEMDSVRMQARSEFNMGPNTNSRYRASEVATNLDEEVNEASLPSVMNRSEIFHENATAAVLALLTPRQNRVAAGDMSIVSTVSKDESTAGLKVSPTKSGVMLSSSDQQSVSAFRVPTPTCQLNIDDRSIISGISNLDMTTDSFAPPSATSRTPILSVDAERALNNVKRKMKTPTKNLADLLTAICTPEDGSPMGRAFMVRRKNACGAVKVLTATSSNRKALCWTVGLLPALTSVLEDTGEDGIEVSFPDARTRAEYIEARRRAIGALVNLAAPKDNRIPIFHSPRLVQSLATVMNDDRNESRQGCCAVTAYLAKTQENRLLMANVPGLIDAMTIVIAPIRQQPETTADMKQKKKYHWDSGTDTDGTGSTTTDRYASPIVPDEEDSQASQDVSPSQSMPVEPYDEDPNKFLHGARQNVFATLMHLVKEKDNAYVLARHAELISTLVEISQFQESPSHVHAIKLIAHLTRHKMNAKMFVFKLKIVVPCLVKATSSENDEARKFALLGLQNLSQDRSCRQEVASCKGLIMALCQRSRQSIVPEEKLAAIATLKNLTDEPANLVPMSNTPECFATLMQIAHGSGEHVNETMQYLACDALATLSHWLRKIATSGGMPAPTPQASVPNLFVPSLKVVTCDQWS